MTRRGRPSTGTLVSVRIPAEVLDLVDTWAAEHELSRAEAIRQLLNISTVRALTA
jgi:metal-responsive CopG/Arc/MetJ family transcriptional regulator